MRSGAGSQQYVAITTRKDVNPSVELEVCFDAFCLRPVIIVREMLQCQVLYADVSLDSVRALQDIGKSPAEPAVNHSPLDYVIPSLYEITRS